MTYATLYAGATIPQTMPLDERQVSNNAGGYVFALDIWSRLDRFLILGSDAPTYYQSAPTITRDNARSVIACWSEDAARTAARIVDISTAGRAPKQSPAIFALALGDVHEDLVVRQAARAAVSSVCRTASHLMEYVSAVQALGRGWGRGLKTLVRSWYEDRDAEALGYQMVKYRARHGLDHGRLIRLAHPRGRMDNGPRQQLYRWGIGKEADHAALPDVVVGHLAAMSAGSTRELVRIIEKHRLTWETIPTEALKEADVWRALLPNLPMTALLRNLATLSATGVLATMSEEASYVAERLVDADQVKRSRLHPYAILQALAVYRMGRSVRGDRTWTPNGRVLDALDEAFYLAFANVEANGKRHQLSLDVSGSMATSMIGGVVSAREASAAMAMVTARTEKEHSFHGFSDRYVPLDISPRMRLTDAVKAVGGLPFRATDCSLPMLHALKNGTEIDVFVIYTDNETYAGSVHPSVALQRYRKETGIAARLVVVGMTSTGFSIADPADAGMLDVIGFDAGATAVMADFVAS